jgi:hypothetical protein
MNAFVNSLKADLFDRRLRALVAALCVGLIAALVYALSGGSSGAPATAPAPTASSGASGIAAVAAPANTNEAVAETSGGGKLQRGGSARDPFTPLPGGQTKPAGAVAQAASSSSAAGKSAQSQSSSGSTSSPAKQPSSGASTGTSSKPSTPQKAKPVYRVAILFGVVPEGTPAQDAQLTPYTNLKAAQKLPSSHSPVLSLHEVILGGKLAVFELLGEALVKGSATCVPSPSQCQSIALAQGKSEEIEFLPAGSTHTTVYELQVVSITNGKAAAARARASLLHRLHAARAHLALATLAGSAGIRSTVPGL